MMKSLYVQRPFQNVSFNKTIQRVIIRYISGIAMLLGVRKRAWE